MAIGDLAQKAREEKGLTKSSDSPSEMSQLIEALRGMQAPAGLTKDDLGDLLQSNAEGMRRALKPENAQHPGVSDYNPLGERDHPRPALSRKVFMSGMELKQDELTADEINLLNGFSNNMEARNGQWRAELRRTATKGIEDLVIHVPTASADERSELPSLTALLLELKGGAQAADPLSLAKRVAELEAKLAGTSA